MKRLGAWWWLVVAFWLHPGCAAQAATAGRLVRADAPVLSRCVQVTVRGRRVTRREDLVRLIATPRAEDRFCDPVFSFLRGSQSIRVLRADTRTAGGRTVALQPRAVNRVLPGQVALAPAYGSLRQLVVTHLGVDLGSRTHLTVERRDLRPRGPVLWGSVSLGDENPTSDLVVEIAGPVRAACVGCGGAFRPASASHRGAVQTWRWKHLPPVRLSEKAGSQASPARLRGPMVVYGSADWPVLGAELARRWNRASAPGARLRVLAHHGVKGKVAAVDRVRALLVLVADRVRSVPVDFGRLGWRPASATETYRRGYGHLLDRTVLLAALLRSQGFAVIPVLVSRLEDLPKHVASPALFSDMGLIVTKAGRRLFVSLRGKRLGLAASSLAGRWVWSFVRSGARPHRVAASAASFVRVVRLTITSTSTPGHWRGRLSADLEATGWLNPYGRRALGTAARLRAVARGWLKGLVRHRGATTPDGASRSRSGSSSRPRFAMTAAVRRLSLGSFGLHVDGSAKVTAYGDHLVAITLPPAVGLHWGAWELDRRSRTTALFLSGTWKSDLHVEICAPDHLVTMASWEDGAAVTHRGMAGSSARHRVVNRFGNDLGEVVWITKTKGRCLDVRRRIVIRRGWIPSRSYGIFRRLVRRATAGRILVLSVR